MRDEQQNYGWPAIALGGKSHEGAGEFIDIHLKSLGWSGFCTFRFGQTCVFANSFNL